MRISSFRNFSQRLPGKIEESCQPIRQGQNKLFRKLVQSRMENDSFCTRPMILKQRKYRQRFVKKSKKMAKIQAG